MLIGKAHLNPAVLQLKLTSPLTINVILQYCDNIKRYGLIHQIWFLCYTLSVSNSQCFRNFNKIVLYSSPDSIPFILLNDALKVHTNVIPSLFLHSYIFIKNQTKNHNF